MMMNYPTGAVARYGTNTGASWSAPPAARDGAGQEWAGEISYQPPGYNNNMMPGTPIGAIPYDGYSAGQPMPSPAGSGTLQMTPNVPNEEVENPLTLDEAQQGSLRALLMKNVGHYVVATFLVGTQSPVSWEGFLHSEGNDYLVLFQPDQGRYITGDFYSLKFVEFHDTAGVKPACAGYRRRDGSQIW